MSTMFENLDIWRPDDEFIISIKDREVTDGERWVVVSITEDEAKQFYEYLKNFFGQRLIIRDSVAATGSLIFVYFAIYTRPIMRKLGGVLSWLVMLKVVKDGTKV